MNHTILATRGLHKKYGGFQALAPLDLTVRRGQIFGLVGRNGAGKTTLLRMITGQSLPSGGELELFGETVPRELNRVRRRTGAMVEAPCFYPYLSAAQNLEYYRIQRGIPDTGAVERLLREVNLEDAGKKKFKNFSLGMKQRLGLALALMNDPDLLILDEPVNGLDPMGIVEIRNTLLRLNQEKGVTILISSHILSEMSSLATHYGFLEKGVMLEQDSAGELQQKCSRCLELSVSDAGKAAALLEQELGCHAYEALPGNLLRVYQFLDEPSRLSSLMVSRGVELYSIQSTGSNLEDYFMQLVGGGEDA